MKMEKQENKMIGANLPIRDAALKVTGALKYTADMKLPRMLYAKVLFSPIPHGKILEIHTEKAEQLPGVKAVVCYKNSPRRAFNSCGEEITPAIGGGFGGKIDMVCEPIAALLAIKTGRPVKLVYNRREDIPSSRTHHGMELKIRTGVQKSGKIVAQEITAWVNAGAYAGGTMSIVWAMSGKFFKLTKIPNLRFRGIPVYTNMPIAGAMRGFGSPQLFFAQQDK